MGNALAPKRRNSVPCTQLGLPDKVRSIKGLVVCNNKDLEPLDQPNGLALGCYQPSPDLKVQFINEKCSFVAHYLGFIKNKQRRII